MNFSKKYTWLMGLLCACCVHAEFNVETAQRQEAAGWAEVPEILARIQPPAFPETVFDLTRFGGTGDGKTDNRPVFEQAIQALAEKGGGKLTVPPGIYWVDGPIVMQSNIHIELQENATIRFSTNSASYLPAVKQRWEGTVCYNYSPLIRGHNLTNLALTGKGTIDGAGADWSRLWRKKQNPDKEILRQMGNDRIPEPQRVFGNGFLDQDGDGNDDGHGDGKPHYLRPPLIQFYECENILFEGLTIMGSPFWTVHPVFCRNITGRNLTIKSDTLNDDGFDPDSCEDVLIEGCIIATHDDAISIKAGRDQDAWNRPGTKNVIIRKNRLAAKANALCIGSEMSGGVERVFMEDNVLENGANALNFKCNLDRGGEVKNIYIRNIQVNSARKSMFIFRMDYHGYRGNRYPTKFSNFFVSNITCEEAAGIPFKIAGVPDQPIRRVYFNNIHIRNAGSTNHIQDAEDILFHNVTVAEKPFVWDMPQE
jgi:polygalacturonase